MTAARYAVVAIGTAVGGSGVLFLMPLIGLQGGFVFVAACIALVTVFIVLPLKEPSTPMAERRNANGSAEPFGARPTANNPAMLSSLSASKTMRASRVAGRSAVRLRKR